MVGKGTILPLTPNVIAMTVTDHLMFTCDVGEFDPRQLLDMIGDRYATEIKQWLREKFKPIDVEKYEGGFDAWWGMGSVTLFELGLKFNFYYDQRVVVVSVV